MLAEEILANWKRHRQVPIKHSQQVLIFFGDLPNSKRQINLLYFTRESVGLVHKGNHAVAWRDPTQLVASRKNCSSALLAALMCLKFPMGREAGLKVNLEGLQGVCR